MLPPPDTSERAPPNPSQTAWHSINLPRRDGRLSLPGWLDTYGDGLPVSRQSPIQVVTVPSVEQLRLWEFLFPCLCEIIPPVAYLTQCALRRSALLSHDSTGAWSPDYTPSLAIARAVTHVFLLIIINRHCVTEL